MNREPVPSSTTMKKPRKELISLNVMAPPGRESSKSQPEGVKKTQPTSKADEEELHEVGRRAVSVSGVKTMEP